MVQLSEMFLDFAKKYELDTETLPETGGAKSLFRIRFSGSYGDFVGTAACFNEDQMLVFLVGMKLAVNEETEIPIMRKILEINERLKIGGFYIDSATGSLGYRLTHYFLGDNEESRTLLASLVVYAGRAAETYFPEFIKAL